MSARDPQATAGLPPRPIAPPCVCDHPKSSHRATRGRCFRWTKDAGPCPCTSYRSVEEAA